MAAIDADAHVHETERTWEYMDGSDRQFQPQVVKLPNPSGDGARDWWVIDGRLQPKEENIGHEASRAQREMLDVEGRLRHMDELNVDLQVIYPTIFLRPLTARPEVEVALCRSYNRWLSDIWAQGHGRLLWAVVPPVLAIDEALAEIRRGKEHGACAVFLRGLEAERRLVDPYFYPIYEESSRLNMPIGIHSGTNSYAVYDFFDQEPGFCKFKLAVVGAFHSLVFSEVPALFPNLRWGIIEVSAQWLPYVVHDLARRFARRGKELPKDLLGATNTYVACQTDDDLDYIIRYVGDDHLVIGTDYGHADTAAEIDALRRLRDQGGVEPASIDKILDKNARVLYGL